MQSSVRTIPTMKRRKPPIVAITPSTPPSPQQIAAHLKPITHSSTRRRNILDPNPNLNYQWAPLGIPKSELNLHLTFPTGQTFRWRQTGPLQYTGVVGGSHLVSLKHLQNGDVSYLLHHSSCEPEAAKLALLDFLNMGISLNELWSEFKVSDSRFADLASHFEGVRVLRQDPLECLVQFICSSNNNISRITKMVDFISGLGKYLGSVGGFDFYQFPSLDRLALVSESELREAGFGYRAKYIIGTVDALQSKPGGGVEWLASLRKLNLEEAIGALCTLPGVGPKVAACIALFSLDQHHAIPVDTHVWKIATRYLIPELAGTRLNAKLHNRIADAFVSKYGQYAGWAQTLLFIAELPSQKAILVSSSQSNEKHHLLSGLENEKKKKKKKKISKEE